jgi:hypothetical protein
MDSATLSGSFGSTRPPKLVSVSVDDIDNGDEAYGGGDSHPRPVPTPMYTPSRTPSSTRCRYGYCDELTFAFDMATDKARLPPDQMPSHPI